MSLKVIVALTSLTMLLCVAVTESGIIVAAIKSQRVEVTFKTSDGKQKPKINSFNVTFGCKEIEKTGSKKDGVWWTQNLSSIKVESSAKFGQFIVLYSEKQCTGKSFKINGNGSEIYLANEPMDFSVIKSYELCYSHDLRLEALNALPQGKYGN